MHPLDNLWHGKKIIAFLHRLSIITCTVVEESYLKDFVCPFSKNTFRTFGIRAMTCAAFNIWSIFKKIFLDIWKSLASTLRRYVKILFWKYNEHCAGGTFFLFCHHTESAEVIALWLDGWKYRDGCNFLELGNLCLTRYRKAFKFTWSYMR